MFMRTIRASYTVFFFCNYNCFPSIVLAIAVLCFFVRLFVCFTCTVLATVYIFECVLSMIKA